MKRKVDRYAYSQATEKTHTKQDCRNITILKHLRQKLTQKVTNTIFSVTFNNINAVCC